MSCTLAIDDRPINRQFLVSLPGYGGHWCCWKSRTTTKVLSARDPHANEERALKAGAHKLSFKSRSITKSC
jgi:hypothetical protein